MEPMFSGPGNDSFRCVFDMVSGNLPVLYSVLWKVDGEFLTQNIAPVNYTKFYLDDKLANTIVDGSKVCSMRRCINNIYINSDL